MGRVVELSLLIVCFVALPVSSQVAKLVSDADFNAYVNDQTKNPPKRVVCEGICADGWVKYNGRCFKYFAKPVLWVAAEAACINLGANLVSVHNEGENQLVKALIRASDPQENPTWLGLSDCQTRGSWFWSDGTKYDYAKWNRFEPNNNNGECCVHINWASEKNWNDIPCELSYPFVCVKKPE